MNCKLFNIPVHCRVHCYWVHTILTLKCSLLTAPVQFSLSLFTFNVCCALSVAISHCPMLTAHCQWSLVTGQCTPIYFYTSTGHCHIVTLHSKCTMYTAHCYYSLTVSFYTMTVRCKVFIANLHCSCYSVKWHCLLWPKHQPCEGPIAFRLIFQANESQLEHTRNPPNCKMAQQRPLNCSNHVSFNQFSWNVVHTCIMTSQKKLTLMWLTQQEVGHFGFSGHFSNITQWLCLLPRTWCTSRTYFECLVRSHWQTQQN